MVMPLVAYYFQQTNPWAVPAGVVLLPATLLTLLAGVAKILITAVCPPLAHIAAIPALALAALLRHSVDLLAHLPGASLTRSAPPIWAIAMYYALLLLPLAPWRKPAAMWAARCAPAVACLLFFFAPLPVTGQFIAPSDSSPQDLRVTFLSIGAGQTALIRVPAGQNFFADCGSTTIPDVFRHTIDPYLRYEGINRIDEIFLSHGDYDHISAAAEIVQAYHVPMVRMTPHFARHAVGSGAAEALLELLNSRGPPPTLTAAGDLINVGSGATLQILWPPHLCDMNSNNCGMVMKLLYAGRSILFTADIQIPPELELLKHPELLKSDVLIAPHHGSAETSTLAFVQAVNPRYIVCSSGEPLTHKQMVFDELARPWREYRTNQYGTIDIDISPGGIIKVETFEHAMQK
jgi:competence protein ComEC